jgi:ankyrin
MIRVLLDAGADPHVATPDGWKALPIASKNGHAKVVRALIDCGAGTATYAPDGRTSFLLAVESGHLETVQIFIDRKANPFALCSSTTFRVGLTTVYHKAAADNNLELVNVFLDAGVPLDHTAFDGNTLLHHAATYGSLRTIRGLLERGADPALRNHKNRRPLCCAALYNETDVVKILLKHVSRRSDSSDLIHSALVTAIGNCSAGIVRLLYDAALASYTTSERNRDPMLIAAERGRTDNVRALLARGAYVDVPGVRGRTPLYMAASCRHLRMVQFLLSQGANPELADSEGMTALHGAARAGCPLVIKALLDGGAQVNHMAMGYLTPLAVAAKREDVLKQLLSHGADAHIICYSCDSTLSTILHSKKRMTFGIPLAHRRSYTVRWRDQLGRSFIHMAAARGFSCCISASIGARVSVNMPDEQQWTPLHWAAYFGHEELSKWLVRIGANPLAIDQQRRTPAHVAAIAGHVTVAQSLDVIPRVENPDYAQDDRWPEAD